MSFAERIAEIALRHLHAHIPNKCKPKSDNEWTVYAALVATRHSGTTSGDDISAGASDSLTNPPLRVISSATGTKCTSLRKCGCVLADCHAEVLVRRGLVRLLLLEIERHLRNAATPTAADPPPSLDFPLLEPIRSVQDGKIRSFRWITDVRLHLYISDSPCGDASIYPIDRTYSDQINGRSFTGAKIVATKDTAINVPASDGIHSSLPVTHISRETVQILGALRTKSGRSNLPDHLRSTSMSCSDKIVRWGVAGIGGGLIDRWIEDPIRISTIVVSRDPRVATGNDQTNALVRALPERIKSTLQYLCSASPLKSIAKNSGAEYKAIGNAETIPLAVPEVAVVDNHQYPNGKAFMTMNAYTSVGNKTKNRNDTGVDKLDDSKNRKRKRAAIDGSRVRTSPCGVAFNWQICRLSNEGNTESAVSRANNRRSNDSVELLVGARGIRQGKKPKTVEDYLSSASRLSRRELWKLAIACERLAESYDAERNAVDSNGIGIQPDETTVCKKGETLQYQGHSCRQPKRSYQRFKQSKLDARQQITRQMMFRDGPLKGWLTSSEANDFHLSVEGSTRG